jgi:hypothetical protein
MPLLRCTEVLNPGQMTGSGHTPLFDRLNGLEPDSDGLVHLLEYNGIGFLPAISHVILTTLAADEAPPRSSTI